jgi:hypothetical protein
MSNHACLRPLAPPAVPESRESQIGKRGLQGKVPRPRRSMWLWTKNPKPADRRSLTSTATTARARPSGRIQPARLAGFRMRWGKRARFYVSGIRGHRVLRTDAPDGAMPDRVGDFHSPARLAGPMPGLGHKAEFARCPDSIFSPNDVPCRLGHIGACCWLAVFGRSELALSRIAS